MYEVSDGHKRQIEQQFHNYCQTVLKHEACDINRARKKQRTCEKSIEELTLNELLELSSCDELQKPTAFFVGNSFILIRDIDLAEALKQLTDYKRDLILLYFFLNQTDQEISQRYNMVRQTVTYQRKSILKQLKRYLEAEELL